MKRILVISPHPDDETIGCGGTLLHHIADGDRVHVVFLTSGEKGGHGTSEAETIALREQEARDATKFLAVSGVEFWRQPDGAVRAGAVLVDRLAQKIDRLRPHVVYAPHPGEMHPDHQAAARLVRRVAKRKNASPATEFLLYEVWTPMQKMDQIVDITPYIERKIKAIRIYRSQNRVVGFDAAFRGLARYRGEMHCWPQGEYAEVFQRLSQ